MKSAEQIIKQLAWSGHLPLFEARSEHSADYAAILILRGKGEELAARRSFQETPYRIVKHARKYLEESYAVESGLNQLAEVV
jgi:hypothetical protein